ARGQQSGHQPPSFGGPMCGPGGGNSAFAFNLTPEGDDVVTHEVATALRLEEQERSAGSGTKAAPVAPMPRAKPVPIPTSAPAKEPKSVGIVGEKSAPLKSDEEE